MATNAVALNGSSQYAKILNWAGLDALDTFTFEGWFYQDASGGTTYAGASEMGDGTNFYYHLRTENATPSTGCNFSVDYTGTNADGYIGSGIFDTNTWVHVAIVGSENAKTKIYKNGVEASYNLQQTPSGTMGDSTGMDVYVGCRDSVEKFFKGAFACFRLWNVARTATELADNKSLYLDPAYESGLLINCNVDEGSGTTLDNDVTGGNDASLFGSPSWTTGPTLTAKNYANITQEGYRFRSDDGDEDGATWLAAQDTSINRNIEIPTRLRVLLDANSDPGVIYPLLEYREETDGTWYPVDEAYTNQGTLVNESMASSPSTGTLNGNATHVSDYLRLTEKVNDQNGSISYTGTLPSDFTVDFDFYADGGADAVVFFFGTTSTSGEEGTADGGYRIYASEYNNRIAIGFNGSDIATYGMSNLGNATWRNMEIIKVGNSFTFKIDSTTVITYTDSTRILSGSYYGWGGRTGGVNAEHRIKNLSLIDTGVSGKIVIKASSYIPTPSHMDNFELNDLTRWSSTSTNSGDLATSSGSALHGSYGLASVINDTSDQYVQQVFADNTTFRCRFYFDPNSISMTNGDEIDIVSTYDDGWAGNFFIKFGQSSGNYYIAVGERTDDAWSTYLGAYTITDAPHMIEVSWRAATGVGNNDGYLELWIDGTSQGSTSTIDNDTGEIHYVQLGSKSKDAGTSGTLYFDDWACNVTGEALGSPFTTAQLTAPSGKTTGDFYPGTIHDLENPAYALDMGDEDYTEVEWVVEATDETVNGEVYEFRVTDAGTPLYAYAVTPEITITTITEQSSTVQAKARIQSSGTTKTITAKARVENVSSATVTAKARVLLPTTKTVTAKSRVLLPTTSTVTAKARIMTIGEVQTVTAKARVQNQADDKTVTAKARIKNQADDKTVTAKARVQSSGTTQTVTAKARVQITNEKTITAKANVQNTTSQTVTAKGRVQNETTQTITAKARVAGAGDSASIEAKARIQTTPTSQIQAMARIQFIDNEASVTAKARVLRVITQTVDALGRVKNVFSTTIDSRARVMQASNTKTIQVKARVLSGTVSTITALARIVNTTTQTVQARASVLHIRESSISAKARVVETKSTTITTKARIASHGITQLISALAHIQKTITTFVHSKARIQKTQTKTIMARARISTGSVTRTISAKANITKFTSEPIRMRPYSVNLNRRSSGVLRPAQVD
jgi:hypothetical protein